MSTRGPDPTASQDELERAIREHSEPFVTATDVAEKMDVARQTAHKHLQRLHKEGQLRKSKIGGSAVIWWYEENWR